MTATSNGLDTRIAGSPAVALRFHLDGHAADLEAEIERTERRLIEATAHRANLMRQLRRNEEGRHRALTARRIQPEVLVRALHDGLAVIDDLSRAEVTVAALKTRLERLGADRELTRTVSARLRQATPDGAALDDRAGRLNQAARSILRILDAEHEALATAVLDGPMQQLSEACFEAEVVERVVADDPEAASVHAARCRDHAAGAAASMEAMAQRLHPVSPHRALVEALRELAVSRGAGRVRLRVLGIERRLPVMSEVALYRIVEEAVDNAAQHGASSRIDIVLSFHRDRVALLVKDDGEGFDVVATEARLGRTRGLGLIKMQEQAALVGSRLEVRSLIGAGTEVRATVAHPA